MKKNFLAFATLFLFSLALFSSCDKDEVTPKTKTELLAQGNWKFKSAFAGTTDISGSLQACQKDNIITFAAAGTGTVDEGAAKCNGADPQTRNFNWNFQTNETKLIITTPLFTGGSSDFDLVSLSETELVVSQLFTPPVGPSQTIVITFVH
jgi:Lipocalin-like domain